MHSVGSKEDAGINITNVKDNENEGNFLIYFILNVSLILIDQKI